MWEISHWAAILSEFIVRIKIEQPLRWPTVVPRTSFERRFWQAFDFRRFWTSTLPQWLEHTYSYELKKIIFFWAQIPLMKFIWKNYSLHLKGSNIIDTLGISLPFNEDWHHFILFRHLVSLFICNIWLKGILLYI